MTMEKTVYRPEGSLFHSPENQAAIATMTDLMQAQTEGRILEARAVRCDIEHNLIGGKNITAKQKQNQ